MYYSSYQRKVIAIILWPLLYFCANEIFGMHSFVNIFFPIFNYLMFLILQSEALLIQIESGVSN